MLKELERVGGGDPDRTQAWIGGIDVDRVFPSSNRAVVVDALQRVLLAIRDRLALRLTYQSFSRPEPTVRWIEPHALAHDGERWHVRAFCREHRDFRDFVLSRIFEVTDQRAARAPREADCGWGGALDLRLAPNPALPVGMRRSLELDHNMKDGVLVMRVRICFVYYVERRFSLDLDAGALDPHRCQLVLLNRDEVERAKAEAGERMRAVLADADC